MQIDQAIAELNGIYDEVPVVQIVTLLNNRKKSTPRLLALIKEILDNYQSIHEERVDFIYALYILSWFKEKKLFH